MGRRAKYLTIAAQRAAARQRKIASRAAQKIKSKPLPRFDTKSLPPLPSTLVEHALELLPDEQSKLFWTALHRPQAALIDENELAGWDCDPPYTEKENTDTAESLERLVEIMHGRNLRLQRLHDNEREDYYSSGHGRVEDYWDELRERIVAEVVGWKKLVKYIPEYKLTAGPREMEMARHRLQWRARRAFGLYRRLEMLCY